MSGDGEPDVGAGNELGIPGLADLRPCGVGSSSTVYRADDVRHDRTVAVKVLSTGKVSADAELTFERELAAMGRLSTHPNIIDLYGSGTTIDRHPYIVMPYYERGNYADLVDENGAMAWEDVVDFGVKIAGALHTAHIRGFVHRDIKPANIFRGEFDRQPILADFGIASFATPSVGGSFTVKVSTTPLYGAPEVLEGDRPTERSDIYSFGATLFALAEGVPAFVDPSTEVVVHRVTAAKSAPRPARPMPAALADLIGEMMARDPRRRPATCLAVARGLVAIQKAAGLDPTPIITDDTDDDAITDHDAGAIAGDAFDDTGDRPATPVEPGFDVDRSPPDPVRPRPVIEPIGSHPPLRGPQSTRPVGSLDRPTEPVAETPTPARPGRATQRRTRPGLGWALLGAAALVASAVAYATLAGNESAPEQEIDGIADNQASAALLTAWAEAGEPAAAWTAHPSAWLTDVEFAPDSTGLATAGTDGIVNIWPSPAAGSSIDRPSAATEFSDWVIDIAWSPTGDRLAVGATDGRVALAPVDGSPPTPLSSSAAAVEAVAWDPDGERVLIGYRAGAIGERSIGTAEEPAAETTLGAHDGDVLDVDWSPSGELAVSSAKDGRVIIWNIESSEPAAVIENSGGRWTRAVQWVAATLLLTTDEDGTVTLRSVAADAATREELSRINIGATVLAADLSLDDGALLAAAYEDGSVRVWDLATGDEVVELSAPAGDPELPGADATTISWSSDGRSLAVGRLDGTVQVWTIG